MPWFKVDDTFAFHPKVFRAGNAAVGLWLRAGVWCNQQLLDGFVPADMVVAFGGSASVATKLVQAGLWDKCDGGYRFHDWDDYQPSKASVQESRDKNAEKLRRWREKKQNDTGNDEPPNEDVTGLQDGSDSVSNPAPRNPAPDPTRPDPTHNKKTSSSSAAQKRGTRIAEDWMPTEDVRTSLAQEFPHVDQRTQHARFIDYWMAKPGQTALKLDWDRTYRNWIREAAERAGGQQNRNVRLVSSDLPKGTPPAELLKPGREDELDQWYEDQIRDAS